MSIFSVLPADSSAFGLFREPPWPSVWPADVTPWQFYYEGVTITSVYVLILCAALVSLPTFNYKIPGAATPSVSDTNQAPFDWPGSLQRTRNAIIIFFCALYISYAIVPLGIFGYSWCTGTIDSRMPLAYGSQGLEVRARVGVHIGVLGVNITMEGLPVNQQNRTIFYNEHFSWSDPWGQGRVGFGKYGNVFNRGYRERQIHGVPTPIQWVAEYFTLDGEWVRWGRNYARGAHYTFEMLRVSTGGLIIVFAIYCVGAYHIGAWLTFVIGALLIASMATFAAYAGPVWNLEPLIIPFRDGNLTCSHGASFWNVVAAGILCMVGSLASTGFAWGGAFYTEDCDETAAYNTFPMGQSNGPRQSKDAKPSEGSSLEPKPITLHKSSTFTVHASNKPPSPTNKRNRGRAPPRLALSRLLSRSNTSRPVTWGPSSFRSKRNSSDVDQDVITPSTTTPEDTQQRLGLEHLLVHKEQRSERLQAAFLSHTERRSPELQPAFLSDRPLESLLLDPEMQQMSPTSGRFESQLYPSLKALRRLKPSPEPTANQSSPPQFGSPISYIRRGSRVRLVVPEGSDPWESGDE
ncbi:hypothetical protein M427DRAFT_495862 [Gonapodya prolifera JEL478]|uniref:Uncharacterized protein n=1 Tax=Gonapodya prolifera (strain JEL478) TaxID=1344416 RepID=A0A139AH97_GONPJ|nr:hypothetical protein M427DRAFT_495862 [Gonapodya prolifera JEL478]|eukprot:KXS16191.1 hypothetical protein M427DRAFT_495862 [Gonapodya prolifera JEL478]